MSEKPSLYAISLMLKEAGFPQPVFSTGQHWYDDHATLYVVLSDYHKKVPSAAPMLYCVDGPEAGSFLHRPFPEMIYEPTVENIMPKLPSWLALECDVDRKTGEVTWSLITRRHGLIREFDLVWTSESVKDPVIACGLAWLHLNSKTEK